MLDRRESNRHTNVLTKSGKRTTSRTAQALTSVTAQHLSRHSTITRMIQKSADKRFARFNKQGRRPRFVTKVEDVEVTTSSMVSAARVVAVSAKDASTPTALKAEKPKRSMQAQHKTAKVAHEKLMKNRRKQARILNVIAKKSQKRMESIKK